MASKKKILMISLGNICRAPMAQCIMQDIINKSGKEDQWQVDRAAIGAWHIDSSPDPRVFEVMERNEITCTGTARQIKTSDFDTYDYIFGMDEDNMKHLKRLAPATCRAKVLMLGEFGLHPPNNFIEDPYYSEGTEAFEKVFIQFIVACQAFFKEAEAGHV